MDAAAAMPDAPLRRRRPVRIQERLRLRTVQVAGRSVRLHQASYGDVMAAAAEGDAGPWWAHVWPSSVFLARIILRGDSLAGQDCLDLGTGAGLVGLALGLQGAAVTFADIEPSALDLAARNARDCLGSGFELLRMDWGSPPDRQFDAVFAADVLYDPAQFGPLARSLSVLLAPGATAWVADPRRDTRSLGFLGAAAAAGLRVDERAQSGGVLLRVERGA